MHIFLQKISSTCKQNEPSHEVASDNANAKKNRYKNIYPCKQTLVETKQLSCHQVYCYFD